MKVISISLVFIIYFSVQKIAASAEIITSEENEEIFLQQIYANMDKGLKSLVRGGVKSALRVFIEISERIKISRNCMSDGMRLLSGLRDLQLWAISFPDACGKLGDGFLSGSNQMLGNYDQCLNSTAYKRNGDPVFHGQYCLISYRPYLFDPGKTPDFYQRIAKLEKISQNVSDIIRLYGIKSEFMRTQHDNYGLCVPSGCSIEDVNKVTKYLGEQIFMNLTVHFCHTEEKLTKTTPRWTGILCFISFIAILAIIGTVLELYSKVKNIKTENIAHKILRCFSIPSNFSRLMETKVENPNLLCIHGIKVLTLFYIILFHNFFKNIVVYSSTNSFSYLFEPTSGFFFQILGNGYLTVDVFFFIGGFLNAFTRFSNSINSRVYQVLIHRLWRIYPAYMSCILIFQLFIPRGPMSDLVQRQYIDSCATDWWKNLLFTNNLYDLAYKCFPHGWYIAGDMQCFLISLFTIPFLARFPKIGVYVNLAVVTFALVYSAVWVYTKSLAPLILMTNVSATEMNKVVLFYFSPIPHIPSYFFGIFMGFYISKKEKIKMSKKFQILGWIIATCLFLTNIFVIQKWNAGARFTRLESAFYATFSKPVHALCIGWLLFCCITGHGGVINYILSLKLWIPLSRISFAAYLISFPLQLFYMGNLRTTIDPQRMRMIWSYFGDITITCLLALVITVVFESPFLALEKIIYPKRIKIDHTRDETVKEKELKEYKNNVSGNTQSTSNSATTEML